MSERYAPKRAQVEAWFPKSKEELFQALREIGGLQTIQYTNIDMRWTATFEDHKAYKIALGLDYILKTYDGEIVILQEYAFKVLFQERPIGSGLAGRIGRIYEEQV